MFKQCGSSKKMVGSFKKFYILISGKKKKKMTKIMYM